MVVWGTDGIRKAFDCPCVQVSIFQEAMNPGVARRGPVGLLVAAKGLTGPADEPESTNPQGFLQIGHAKYCPPWISPSPRPYRRNIRYTLETLFKKVDK